ncbi:MAG: alpha/beta fold hydrolase [Planctomycetota bacterium]
MTTTPTFNQPSTVPEEAMEEASRETRRGWRRWARRAAFVAAAVLASAVLIAAGVAWYAAGQLLELAPQVIGAAPDDFKAETVSFASPSGSQIAGWYRPGEPGRGVVVLLHGIRSSRTSSLPRAKLIAEAGFSTLLIDLRCHGESAGDQITLGSLERLDVQAAVAFAKSRNPGEPTAVVGFSLGGAATVLAAPLDVDAVVLEAVFPTIEAAVSNRTRRRFGVLEPLATWALLAQLEPRTGIAAEALRPADRVADLGCPVLIVGGTTDVLTTPDDTRRLFAAAAEPKQLGWFTGLAHQNYAYWQPDEYRSLVVEFLSRRCGAAGE